MIPPVFNFREISRTDFRKLLRRFKPKKVHGCDWIDAFTLKLAAPLIEDALIHIINLSLRNGLFASKWKPQLIFPNHKKNERNRIENYRPESHVIQIRKMVELAAQSQIVAHFENNKLFHPNQYGSVANHSTSTAIIHVYERWLEATEKDKLAASCF